MPMKLRGLGNGSARYAKVRYFSYSSGGTMTSSTGTAGAPFFTKSFSFWALTFRCRRYCFSPSRSASGETYPAISSFSEGFSDKRRGQGVDLLEAIWRDRGESGLELHVLHPLAAAERCPPSSANGEVAALVDEIPDDLEDDAPDTELRIIEAPGHGNVEVNLPIPVFEQGHRQLDGKARRRGAVHLLPEGELVDENLVLRVELPLVDEVLQIEGQLALFDDIPDVLSGVR